MELGLPGPPGGARRRGGRHRHAGRARARGRPAARHPGGGRACGGRRQRVGAGRRGAGGDRGGPLRRRRARAASCRSPCPATSARSRSTTPTSRRAGARTGTATTSTARTCRCGPSATGSPTRASRCTGPSSTARALGLGDEVAIAVEVENVGERAGDEVVQLYVRDEEASVTRPVKELRGFRRVHLAPGERSRVTFRLAAEQLAFTGPRRSARARARARAGDGRHLVGRPALPGRPRAHGRAERARAALALPDRGRRRLRSGRLRRRGRSESVEPVRLQEGVVMADRALFVGFGTPGPRPGGAGHRGLQRVRRDVRAACSPTGGSRAWTSRCSTRTAATSAGSSWPTAALSSAPRCRTTRSSGGAVVDASLIVDNFGVVPAATGEGVGAEMAMYGEAVGKLG